MKRGGVAGLLMGRDCMKGSDGEAGAEMYVWGVLVCGILGD